MTPPDFTTCNEEELWRYVAWHLEGAGIRSVLVEGRTLRLLSPTDCVKDRMAAYIHWSSRAGFNQALLVCRRQYARVDFEKVAAWCQREGGGAAYEELARRLSAPEIPDSSSS